MLFEFHSDAALTVTTSHCNLGEGRVHLACTYRPRTVLHYRKSGQEPKQEQDREVETMEAQCLLTCTQAQTQQAFF